MQSKSSWQRGLVVCDGMVLVADNLGKSKKKKKTIYIEYILLIVWEQFSFEPNST